MNDVWQSYSQEGYKNRQPEERQEEQFESFTVTEPNMILQLLLFLAVIPSFFLLEKYHFPVWAFFLIPISYTTLVQILRHYFKWRKEIQLYNDKLIIKNKKTKTINFSSVKRYAEFYGGSGAGFSWHFIIFKQNDGKKTIIRADNKEMLQLVSAFNYKMEFLITSKGYPIEKYDPDEEFAKYAIPITIIVVGSSIIISVIVLLWHNGLRPDYS